MLGRRRSGRRRRVGREPVFGVLLDLPPMRDVLEMLVQRLRERVAAGAVGDEIELLRPHRVRRRLERRFARIADRSRRQAVDIVGVVRRRLIEFGLGDRMAERSLAEHQPVDDRRIRLQPHVFLQAIDEDAGDPRRSSALPVSFSTIEASVTSSPGDLIGRSGARFAQISSTALAWALAMRVSSAWRVSPSSNR